MFWCLRPMLSTLLLTVPGASCTGCRGRKRKLLPSTPALLGRLAKLDSSSSPEDGADAGCDAAKGKASRGALAQLRGGNGARPVRQRRRTQFFGY